MTKKFRGFFEASRRPTIEPDRYDRRFAKLSFEVNDPRFPLPDGFLDEAAKKISPVLLAQQNRLMREALLGTSQATAEPEPEPLRLEDMERAMASLRAMQAVQPPPMTIITSKAFRADKAQKVTGARDIFLMLYPSWLDQLAQRCGPLVPNVEGYAPQYMGVPIVDIDITDEDTPAQRARKEQVIERLVAIFAQRAGPAQEGAKP